jgi:hypothetical protein
MSAFYDILQFTFIYKNGSSPFRRTRAIASGRPEGSPITPDGGRSRVFPESIVGFFRQLLFF